MSEKLLNNRNHQPLDTSKHAAELPLELVKAIDSVENQFAASLDELVMQEISDAKDELLETPETETMQERYGLAFDPYKVVTGIGRFAIIGSNPELAKRIIEREAIQAIEDSGTNANIIDLNDFRAQRKEINDMSKTIYRENGLAYAQDQPELEQYALEATRIIDALMSGDDSLLDTLPSGFADALRVRITSYENGISSDERDAMISATVNGLAEKNGENLSLDSKVDDEDTE